VNSPVLFLPGFGSPMRRFQISQGTRSFGTNALFDPAAMSPQAVNASIG
jgi:hypothetical protein